MEIPIENVQKLESGKHTGTIAAVQYRDNPYKYVDVVINVKDTKMMMKAGFPAFINANSKLGELLQRFGATLEVGTSVDPEKILLSKKVEFVAMEQQNKKDGKTYSNIIPESIKPLSK